MSNSDDVKPALTGEEWESPVYLAGHPAVQVRRHDHRVLGVRVMDKLGTFYARDRHALAALALYQQPYGFTREDVSILRVPEVAQAVRWAMLDRGMKDCGADSLAARIAALLPPEPTDG